MKKKILHLFFVSTWLCVACFSQSSQPTSTATTTSRDPLDYIFLQQAASIKNTKIAAQRFRAAGNEAAAKDAEDSIPVAITNPLPFLLAVPTQQEFKPLLSGIEQDRFDKQTGTDSNAAGSTSLVSKGSVPALFSLAVENGALTRSISGTTITFRGSPANIYSALSKGGYIPAGPAVPEFDGSFQAIAKRASFYLAFDTSRGSTGTSNAFTGNAQQLSGWGIRYDIYNKRDPRRHEYAKAWADLLKGQGVPLANRITALSTKLRDSEAYKTWKAALTAKLMAAQDSDVPNILKAASADFNKIVAGLDAESQTLVNDAAATAKQFAIDRADTINSIMRSWTIAAEYNVINQANTNGTVPSNVSSTNGTTLHLPDLGSFSIVVSKGMTDGPEFTANASFTLFQNIPTGLNVGRIRDARASAQLDFPMPKIEKIGKPTFTMSSQFISLMEEPLGQQVLINNVAVKNTGNIGLVQGKFTIPTSGMGVSIPLSVTWSNRTELIKESDVRGSIGISFDMDKLFSKP